MSDGPLGAAPGIDRRRSDRVSQSIPLVIRGVDLLGQQFEERATTTNLNVQGCRYASRHHLPKNAWVTVDVEPTSVEVRARVVWIEHPQSIRDYFQIALELESPLNPWGLEAAPQNWTFAQAPAPMPEPVQTMEPPPPQEAWAPASAEGNFGTPMDTMPVSPEPMGQSAPEFFSSPNAVSESEPPQSVEYANAGVSAPEQFASAPTQVPEVLQSLAQQLESLRQNAEAAFAETVQSKVREMQAGWEASAGQVLDQCHSVLTQLDDRLQALRWESASANDLVNRLGAARQETEVQQAAAQETAPAESAQELEAATKWRERIESSTAAAVVQWDELLQNSLDSGVGRIAERISAELQTQLHSTTETMAERSVAFRQSLEEISAEARDTIASIHGSLDQEVSGARASLAEIEQLAARLREHSLHLEAVSRDTLDQVGQRLGQMVEAHAAEMNRRVESLIASVPERAGSDLEALSAGAADRAVRHVEAQIQPKIERIEELSREMSGREMQVEENLRLYRERLRQVSQSHEREVDAHLAGTVASLRDDFETARGEALGKWGEELDAAGVRASHAASESLAKASEWFEQETRGRLQIVLEQTLGLAMSAFDERMGAAAQNFEAQMHEKFSRKAEEIQQRVEETATEASGRARSQIDQAAEAAASSFGEVIRGISERERANFEEASRGVLSQHEGRVHELGAQAEQHVQQSGAAVDQLRGQLNSEIETSVTSARNSLAAELGSLQESHRAQGDERHREWTENLRRTADENAAQHREHLDAAGEAWVASLMQRLNEGGQDLVESLMRSADTALRESWSKILEGLAATLREREYHVPSDPIMPPPGAAPEAPSQTQ